MTDRDLPTRTEGETLDMPEGMGAFGKGQVLGERYQIIEMLGRGGMGEVWRAYFTHQKGARFSSPICVI